MKQYTGENSVGKNYMFKHDLFCTKRNRLDILATKIRLYLPLSNLFGTKRDSIWFQVRKWYQNDSNSENCINKQI